MKKTILISVTIFSAFMIAGYLFVAGFIQTTPVYCEDKELRGSEIGKGFYAIWTRRNCSFLYGGPYTVVKLKNSNFPYIFVGANELIEIEDDNGNFLPVVSIDGDEILLSGVPDYLKYTLKDKIFGLKVRINNKPL